MPELPASTPITVAMMRKHLDTLADDAVLGDLQFTIIEPPAAVPPGDLDRADLITLCADGILPPDRWTNRESSWAQRQLGECRALLVAGCDFEVQLGDSKRDRRDAYMYSVHIRFPGFNTFEHGHANESKTYYVPTRARLNVVAGGDWSY